MSDLSSLVQNVGGAVSALFSSAGNAAQAKDYSGAAALAEQNAGLAAASTRIQEAQAARTVNQSIGTTAADMAGAGFTESGSGLDVLRASAQQGALQKSLINIQGAINENSYAAQAGAYSGEAKAANEANTAGQVKAIASIGGALIDGAGTLANAGKTVVSGYNYISGLFSGAATQTTAVDSAFQAGANGIAGAGLGEGLTNDVSSQFASGLGVDTSLVSSTDSAISAGAAIDTSSSLALDTSGLGIGSAFSDVSSAVSDAFSSLSTDLASSLGVDMIPGIGWALGAAQLLDSIPAVRDIPVVGDVLNGVVTGVGDVVNGVVSVVGDVGSAIGSVFGSVICTALYKRDMLSRRVWWSAQRYGRDIAPEHIYKAYLLWGQPIANMITKHAWFAKLVAHVFVPWAHELAVLAGSTQAVSTLRGRIIFKTTYALSHVLGKIIYRKKICQHYRLNNKIK